MRTYWLQSEDINKKIERFGSSDFDESFCELIEICHTSQLFSLNSLCVPFFQIIAWLPIWSAPLNLNHWRMALRMIPTHHWISAQECHTRAFFPTMAETSKWCLGTSQKPWVMILSWILATFAKRERICSRQSVRGSRSRCTTSTESPRELWTVQLNLVTVHATVPTREISWWDMTMLYEKSELHSLLLT